MVTDFCGFFLPKVMFDIDDDNESDYNDIDGDDDEGDDNDDDIDLID